MGLYLGVELLDPIVTLGISIKLFSTVAAGMVSLCFKLSPSYHAKRMLDGKVWPREAVR